MKAKDTAMSIDDLLLTGIDFNKKMGNWLHQSLKAQAEISFKAGQKEEWARVFNRLDKMNEAGYFDYDTEEAIARLKEWEIYGINGMKEGKNEGNNRTSNH